MTTPEAGMSVMAAIQARRSVRDYAPGRIGQATIRALLDAAVLAPTAVHEEPWAFVIVQDTRVLQSLSDRAKAIFAAEAERNHPPQQTARLLETLNRPGFNIFYNAGTLIIICSRPKGPFVVADCWLAAENLLLAACSMGLGSCVIGMAVAALNTPAIKAEFGIPADCAAVAPIILGLPAGATPATSRKPPDILGWK